MQVAVADFPEGGIRWINASASGAHASFLYSTRGVPKSQGSWFQYSYSARRTSDYFSYSHTAALIFFTSYPRQHDGIINTINTINK